MKVTSELANALNEWRRLQDQLQRCEIALDKAKQAKAGCMADIEAKELEISAELEPGNHYVVECGYTFQLFRSRGTDAVTITPIDVLRYGR